MWSMEKDALQAEALWAVSWLFDDHHAPDLEWPQPRSPQWVYLYPCVYGKSPYQHALHAICHQSLHSEATKYHYFVYIFPNIFIISFPNNCHSYIYIYIYTAFLIILSVFKLIMYVNCKHKLTKSIYFVMFLQNFAESSEIQILIILEQNKE